jgi:hypothetical protein
MSTQSGNSVRELNAHSANAVLFVRSAGATMVAQRSCFFMEDPASRMSTCCLWRRWRVLRCGW